MEQLHAPYDLVLASFSLGMPDIRTALLKMDACCSGEVVCFWSSGTSVWEGIMRHSYEALHNKPYIPAPKADLLVRVLEDEGISPCFEEYEDPHRDIYESCDAAIDAVMQRLSISEDSDSHASLARKEIGSYLQDLLVEKDGKWYVEGMNCVGRVSWKT